MNLDSDTLWRSAIRRELGFDFDVRIEGRTIHVRDLELGNQILVTIPQGKMTEKVINKLSSAVLELKEKHEEQTTD